MARRVIAGIVGCLIGVLPLAVVNVLANDPSLLGDPQTAIMQNAVVFGAIALLGGVLLGGTIAGWVAGRGGGASAGGAAGIIAGMLYAVTVILVVVGGARQGWGPPIAAVHPIRTSAAILLVAALLVAVAMGVGAVAGPGRAQYERAMPAEERRAAGSGSGGSRSMPRGSNPLARPSPQGRPQGTSRPPSEAPVRRSLSRDRW